MSESTPAALKASASSGRSLFSQRFEDAVSGRITPTLAFVSGLLVLEPPLEPLVLDESSLPHAATVNARAAATANAPRARCFMFSPSSGSSADGDYLRIRSIHSQMAVSRGSRRCATSQHESNSS